MRGHDRAPSWPKRLPELTAEQRRIHADWYRVWMEDIAGKRRYRAIDRFQCAYPARRPPPPGGRTLEIGAGYGNQIQHEDLSAQEYVAVDLREEMVEEIRRSYPQVTAIRGDIQQGLDLPDAHFDRVIAIQVLEHLPDLPPALDEVRRLMKPGGEFLIVIPCEGGRLYDLARAVSSKPKFERRYGTDFGWFVASEHCNVPWEIEHELRERFEIAERRFFPFGVPSVNANLLIAITATPGPG